MSVPTIGHNAEQAAVRVEARFFNTLTRFVGDGGVRVVDLPPLACVGDLISMFRVPLKEIFLVLRNGRDITPGIYQGGVVNQEVALENGDVIAFSGPVPYSYGFGAPVV
jgi:hypothetical protein